MEYDDLIKIRALIKTAYRGTWDESLYSDWDIMFQSLQSIETMIEDELKSLRSTIC